MPGFGMGRGGGSGGPIRARALTATVPLTTGMLTTVSSFGLLAPVVFAKTGGSANLSINSSSGAISASAALSAGATQSLSGTVTGADGCVVPFSAALTGAGTAPPAPAPGIADFSDAAASGLIPLLAQDI